MKKNYREIPIEDLTAALRYDAKSGKLFWKQRKDRSPQWNGRYSGKEAFTAEFVGGYKHGDIFGIRVRAHRVVWAIVNGEWPNGSIDHINGDPRDNRIENLRVATAVDQNRNQRLQSNNKSGCVGVYWSKAARKWAAQIGDSGKMVYLGLFDRKEDAVNARKNANKKLNYHENHGALR